MYTIRLKLKGNKIFYGSASLKTLNRFLSEKFRSSSYFILTDRRISKYCLPLLLRYCPILKRANIIEINGGEEAKNIDSCQAIWNYLLRKKAERTDLIINLGGGVITDIGGFVAATFKRGIPFINIPTTLMAMIDAATGGKNGIDFRGVKNAIGAFTVPEAVCIYHPFLITLPRREFNAGLAEALKHGLIANRDYWNLIRKLSSVPYPQRAANEHILKYLIKPSVRIKTKITYGDPLEHGSRKLLNFGHTIGHAAESFFLTRGRRKKLLHGEAISTGLICEAYLSHLKKSLSARELEEIVTTVLNFFPRYPVGKNNYNKILDFMENDKKNRNGKINFTLLKRIGNATTDNFCGRKDIVKALTFYDSVVRFPA